MTNGEAKHLIHVNQHRRTTADFQVDSIMAQKRIDSNYVCVFDNRAKENGVDNEATPFNILSAVLAAPWIQIDRESSPFDTPQYTDFGPIGNTFGPIIKSIWTHRARRQFVLTATIWD